MADPLSLLLVANKLLGLGLAGLKAWNGDWDADDIEVLDASVEAADASLDLKAPRGHRGRVRAAILLAFFSAFSEHWAGSNNLAPVRARRWWDWRKEPERQKDLASRIHTVLERPRAPEESTADPLAHPLTKGLWAAISDGRLGEPLVEVSGTGARAFESDFLRAWEQLLARDPELCKTLELADGARALRLRALLLHDMASWGRRHLFGNQRWETYADQVVPFLALEDYYVEPDVEVDGKSLPLLDALEQLLTTHKILVLSADFGHGKSLAARGLASRLATRWADSANSARDLPLPILIRCGRDLVGEGATLKSLVPEAWRSHLEELGVLVSVEDPVLLFPEPGQRALFILDGLDEAVLSSAGVEGLLRHLRSVVTDRHHVLVVTRPGVLPRHPQVEVEELELPGLSEQGVRDWLSRWNRGRRAPEGKAPILAEQVMQGPLEEVSQTPILLFMLAMTWGEQAAPQSLTDIYEAFFCSLARGKYEHDKEHHPKIARASEELLTLLREKGRLPAGAKPDDAMLWLLGRVAWEAHRLERQSPPIVLSSAELEVMLKNELGLRDRAVLDAVKIGLLLALQADPREAGGPVFFGHKSFREYGVARFWEGELKLRVRDRYGRGDGLPEYMMGTRVLGGEDRSFEFLLERLRGAGWEEGERKQLAEWALGVFMDQSLDGKNIAEDRRSAIRELALALATELGDVERLNFSGKGTVALRSLLAWGFVVGEVVWVMARGMDLSDTDLSNANLSNANLSNAKLWGTNLLCANLAGAILSHAQMMTVNLSHANLSYAILRNARSPNAKLHETNLSYADLRDADFLHANFFRANFLHANLSSTDLSSAELIYSNLSFANLSSAILTEANLSSANLSHADLSKTNLSCANLFRADLSYANLSGANLMDANLMDADLMQANLQDATYTSITLWPLNFKPIAAGAILLPDPDPDPLNPSPNPLPDPSLLR